jgi:hypothetical protein
LDFSELDPVFLKKADLCYQHLFKNLKPIALNNFSFDGTTFGAYVEDLVG